VPSETAIVLIHFQNDFTTPGGALYDAVARVMQRTGMLANAEAALIQARNAGATVIHAPISFAQEEDEHNAQSYGIVAGVVQSNAFIKGSWGAEITEALTPEPGDIIVEGKRGLDAFASSDLDLVLRGKGIKNVALCGFLTNCCVESTMRTAYDRGYNVLTLTDCLSATSIREHETAISESYPMFSLPLASTDFVASLAANTARSADIAAIAS
jgi:nicotinamidase-related amidase